MKQAKVLNDQDIKIIKAVINDSRYSVRTTTMFLLALNCGLRAKEIASIKVKDVLNADHKIKENCVLSKEQTKMGQANRIFFNHSVQKQLKAYFDEHSYLKEKSDSPLFITKNGKGFSAQTVINKFSDIFKKANMDGASSHSMRRTFATQLNENATSVFTIQKLMRHKNIATTQLYVNVTDVQLARAANNLGF
jgi:integrase/recombinase XerD